MKKIIIFHISQLGGHKKAAENIKEALEYKAPSLNIFSLNIFDYISPLLEKKVNFLYGLTIKYLPQLWGKFYDRKIVIKTLTPLQKIINRYALSKIRKLINKVNPSLILATQAFPCGIIADFKRIFNSDIPLIGVVTDYYPHRFWLYPEVDFYTVASWEAKEILIKEGIEEEKVKIAGIPISIKFLSPFSRKEIAQEFGFDLNLPTVLIMGGGLGIGQLDKIVKIIDESFKNLQIIVVCGKNRKLYKWFKRNFSFFQNKVFYFGYIDFVHKLMDFSDIIITKAGGLTVSEALAKGLATILVNPIPGQEERNAHFLLKKGAILKAEDLKEISIFLKSLLKDKNKLFSLKEKAKNLSIIDSSLRIAEVALSCL